MDAVFKALADPTRRLLLDRLREQNGQTLGQLCEHLGMTRQSATQHLDILAEANLVVVVRHGRQRLHYLNPAPIHEIEERWISEFDKPRLQVIGDIKHRAEEYAKMSHATTMPATTSTTIPTFVYATYIRASADQVWQALTDADLTARYWGHRNVSDWQKGSTWEHQRLDDSKAVDIEGRVIESVPPTRLVFTFEAPGVESPGGPSVVTFQIEPHAEIVRLIVTHENLPDQEMLNGISLGWPAILANLKSLLETGEVLPGVFDMAGPDA
jgi:uncharacterized protein YndB with AHSA1/START domain/DNA-binding transcriptional ArsR family regulator